MRINGAFSLRFKVFIFAAISGLIPLLLTIVILFINFMTFFEERIEKEIMHIAMGVAEVSDVKNAFSFDPPQTDLLQKTSNDLKNRTGAYVFFMDMTGKALIDPYPFNVRAEVIGEDKNRVLRGEFYISRSSDYSTPSIRAFVPVLNNNRQVGAVVAAFLEPDLKLIFAQLEKSVYVVVPIALLLILILSMHLANNIKRKLFGMEPQEIATRLIEREGILHSVKEGIIATDEQLNITVVNQSAAALFPKDTKLIGAKITELISDSIFQTVITTNQPQYNKQFLINENIVIANSFPLYIKDRAVGTVITFSNLTEANRLAEELTGVRKIVEALRARTHEFSNKLHAISGLIELGSYEEAKKYVTRVASNERTLISCLLSNFRANAVAGLLMGKVSEAEEKGIRYEIDKDSNLFTLPDYFDEHALVIVLGNLIENAFDAAKKHADNPEVHVSVKQTETMIEIKVRDNGPGISPKLKDKIFEPGFTTKSSGTGYGLYNVKSRVKMANGEISFTNEKKGTTFFLNIPFDVLLEQKQGGER